MNRKNYQSSLARAAMVLLVAMLSVVTVRAEEVNIGTVAEWNAFAARVNGGETTLDGLLTADLDFGGETFTIVGTSTHPFCGTFDGAGHTITGISVSKSGDADGSRLGLFGSVGSKGVVKNVTITGSSFAGWDYVGGIAGYNQGGIITNCHVTSSVTIGSNSGKEHHGGIVGYNSSIYSIVSHCTSGAIVTNSGQAACHYFGGIVGNNSGGTVEYCLAVGATVSAVTNSGAIAGSNTGTLSYNYYANCRVGETTSNIGIGSGDVSTNDGAMPAILLYDQGTEAAGNTTTISDNSSSEKNVVLYGRTLLKTGDWNTLCLPFSLTAEQIAASPLAGGTLMELDTDAGSYAHVTGFENGTLYLNFKTATSITAGTPYIIKWETTGDNITSPVFTNVTIDNSAEALARKTVTSEDGVLTFTGTYGYQAFTEEDKSILLVGAGNSLYYPASGASLGACRAYFQLNGDVSGSVKMFFGEEENATSLSGELRVKSEESDNAVYDLSGRKVNSQFSILNSQLKKGLYIKNGKKVLIKK